MNNPSHSAFPGAFLGGASILPGPMGAASPHSSKDSLVKTVQQAIEASKQKAVSAKRTHIIFVLDGSGSMVQGKEMTMAAFNDQLRIVREASKDAGHTTVSLIVFSYSVEVVFRYGELEAIQPLTHANYHPEGGTALYDAIGKAVKLVLKADGFGEPDTAFLVTVLTDGGENSSRKYSGGELAQCVQALEATKTVSFSILGPQEHLRQLGDVLHIERSNIGGFDTSSLHGRAMGMSEMVGATASYMALRSEGVTQMSNLYARGEQQPAEKA
jgi:uncharacterized protein YegL